MQRLTNEELLTMVDSCSKHCTVNDFTTATDRMTAICNMLGSLMVDGGVYQMIVVADDDSFTISFGTDGRYGDGEELAILTFAGAVVGCGSYAYYTLYNWCVDNNVTLHEPDPRAMLADMLTRLGEYVRTVSDQ